MKQTFSAILRVKYDLLNTYFLQNHGGKGAFLADKNAFIRCACTNVTSLVIVECCKRQLPFKDGVHLQEYCVVGAKLLFCADS